MADVPDPPVLLSVDCHYQDAAIKWQPMDDNRAPILGYIIQFNTSFTPDTWENAIDSVPASITQFSVSFLLSCQQEMHIGSPVLSVYCNYFGKKVE